MKFEAVEIERFGALKGRVLELGGRSAVIFGPNEAGKSQVRDALRSVLVGFHPPRLDRHPARPVDGPEGLAVAAVLRARGTLLRTERALDGGGERAEGAPALPVSAEVDDDLFVIGPDEMARFHAAPSAVLRRLILGDGRGGPGIDGLTAALEKERARLWRPDRRSRTTRVLELDRELARVGEELRTARAVEAGLLDLEEELASMGQRLGRAEEELRAALAEREVLERIERVARAVRAAEPPAGVDGDALAALPRGASLPAPGPLLAELDAAEDACVAPRERLAAGSVEVTAAHLRVLEAADEIDAVCDLDPERARLAERADEQGARAKALEVRARAARRLDAGPSGTASFVPVAAMAALAGFGAYVTPGGPLAAAAAGVGVLAAGWWGRRTSGPGGRVPGESTELEADAVAASEQAGACARRAEEIDGQLRTLARAAGLSPHTDRGTAARLRRALAEARAAAERAEGDALERRRSARELESAEERRVAADRAVRDATERLAAIAPGERSPIRAHELASEALLRRQRLEGALAEIAADRRRWEAARDHPAFADALSSGRFDGETRTTLDAEITSLRATIDTLREAIARGDQRLAAERPARPMAELRSEELHLRAIRAQRLDEHDRLALLAEILREGERRHRAAHAPALLRRAGELLAHLTAGRWSHLDLDGDGHVVASDGVGTWPIAPPLSRGLREEVHLCLRLAALDAAEDGAEPLPLLLDEVFAHWDAGRRGRGLDLLAHLAGERQLVLFSCRRDEAEEMARRLDAVLLSLAG